MKPPLFLCNGYEESPGAVYSFLYPPHIWLASNAVVVG
jgi:hypothetical protein